MNKDQATWILVRFRELVGEAYEYIDKHPENEPVVDKLVEDVSARFSREPNYAVTIAVWNAIRNCVDGQPNPDAPPAPKVVLQ